METIGDLISCVKLMQKFEHLSRKIGGAYICILDGLDLQERQGKRLRFGISLDGHYLDKIPAYAIKFEERRIAQFTVGVYSKEKASIQYNIQTPFVLNDPLKKLVDEFPNNCYIEEFVNYLINA